MDRMNAATQSHLQRQEFVMNFCIEIRRDSNPHGSNPRSPKALGLDHSANRVYTTGTRWFSITCGGNPSAVPVVYTRVALEIIIDLPLGFPINNIISRVAE